MTTVKQTNSKHYKTHFVVFIFFWILQHTNKDIHQCTQQKANHIIQNFNQQFAHARAQTHTHTHTFYGPLDCVWDYPSEPVPEPSGYY